MGEEKKEEEKKEEKTEEKKEEEKNDEKKEEEEAPEIVLKVDMHCEACARKVAKALKGFEGVEEVRADSKGSKVVVKGKAADPIKVCERLQKKSGKKVLLISPLPEPPPQDDHQKQPPKEQQDKKDEKKQGGLDDDALDEPPPAPVVTVVLKVRMHCEACAQLIQKRIHKIQGVESVETELGKDQVIVKGVIDPSKLVDEVYKRTKKQASIVKEEEKKDEEKKEEEKEKKDEKKEEEKKEAEEEDEEDESKTDIKRSEYWPSRNYVDYYAYAPQIFSDENPNACSVM